tara:strand:+ start:2463 stop:3389 length:927 start_codon:yes stop_codon:yes gene_type:complete
MSSGSKSAPAAPQTQVVKQETIPPWLQPYVEDVAKRGQAISQEDYQPYRGARTATFDPMERRAFTRVGNLKRPGELGRASRTYGQIAGGSGGFDTGTFGAAEARQYMSPYQQAVTDVAIRKAQEEATRQGGLSQLGAAARGSAGGSRSAIMDAMRMRGLTDTVGDLQAKGDEQAFRLAQRQFELDRTAGMTQAERDRQARLSAAQGLTGVGAMEQRLDLQRLAAQQAAGAERRGRTQSIYDQRYADFLRQRDYPKEQLGWYSNIVRGLPAGLASSSLTYAKEPSFGQQAVGAGLGLASIYGMGGGFRA